MSLGSTCLGLSCRSARGRTSFSSSETITASATQCQTPTSITFPTLAQQHGDFTATGVNIYDPITQGNCTANNGGIPCRYQYGYTHVTGSPTNSNSSNPGNGTLTGAKNVIPSSEFSPVALNLQKNLLPALIQPERAEQLQRRERNRPQRTGQPRTVLTGFSRRRTRLHSRGPLGVKPAPFPVGQTTSGRNVGPVPYNYGQAYAPKTAVGIIEETHVFTPHVINQIQVWLCPL